MAQIAIEVRHPDFAKIHSAFLTHYSKDPKLGEQRYTQWLSALGLDDSKPYCKPQERFQWAKNLIEQVKEDPEARYYKVEALFPLESINQNLYTREELLQATRTLTGKPSEQIQINGKTCIRKNLFPADYTLTDSYQDGAVIDLRLSKNVKLAYKNTHNTNTLKYKILACIDPTDWRVVKDETTLTANTSDDDSIPESEAWCFLKMQTKNSIAGQTASITGFAAEKS
jgi:hypothetical protein